MSSLFEKYRYLLTDYDSLVAYSFLGIVAGVAASLTVLAFDLAIDELETALTGAFGAEGLRQLSGWTAFALPTIGAALLGCAYAMLKPADRETGIVHVISRMHSHYSVLPLRNALVQFFGGIFALATGQSGGREGPGVHLGGAVTSLMGQWLGLPNNSLRMLIACGTAGGIAAAFQTPLAGVIFAMEVIVAEYTVAGFIPVILAAVSASAVSHLLSTETELFLIEPIQLNSMMELPYIILLGFCCGLAVSLFIRISRLAATFSSAHVALRFTLAGCITGLLALWVPDILGISYDSMGDVIAGNLAIPALLAICICKLVATAVSCGVGMPIGLIGPSLLIGACIGGSLGIIGQQLQPDLASEPTLYVVIGMGAAMGAILNAPLAAILAVVEMTQTIGMGMAAMLAIVTATLTNTSLFGQRSAHQTVLRQLRRLVPSDPLTQLLHRTAVTSTMDSRAVRVPALLTDSDREPLLEFKPTWCLLEREGQDLYLVRGEDLLNWLSQQTAEQESVDLTGADIRRWSVAAVPLQATLRQALDTMSRTTTEAVYVTETSRTTGNKILHGVLTKESVERFSLAGLK